MSATKKTRHLCMQGKADQTSACSSAHSIPVTPQTTGSAHLQPAQSIDAQAYEAERERVRFASVKEARAHIAAHRQWALQQKATRYQHIRLALVRWILTCRDELQALKRLVKECVFVAAQHAKHEWKRR